MKKVMSPRPSKSHTPRSKDGKGKKDKKSSKTSETTTKSSLHKENTPSSAQTLLPVVTPLRLDADSTPIFDKRRLLIQQEWEQREWLNGIYSDIETISLFINRFHATVHDRLGNLNERLTSLGRTMDLLEAKMLTSETGFGS